jgi:hypothetical protein
MSDIKIFLKTLNKLSYPDTSPDVPTVAEMIDYNISHFLQDLTDNVGMEGANNFVEKSFSSLGLMGEGLKIDLSDEAGEKGSYIYLIINSFDIELSDREDEYDEVWIHYSWGKDKLIHDGEEKTLDDIYDEVDMGGLGEWGEFMDTIQDTCQSNIFKKTGFLIHFDSQI